MDWSKYDLSEFDTPLTTQELELIERVVANGTLGLYRSGTGENRYFVDPLLPKLVRDYRALIGRTAA